MKFQVYNCWNQAGISTLKQLYKCSCKIINKAATRNSLSQVSNTINDKKDYYSNNNNFITIYTNYSFMHKTTKNYDLITIYLTGFY